MTLIFMTYVTERRFVRADGKYRRKRTRRKKARQKGGLCTLDGVPALNVEGRGPYNDWAVSFLSSFPSLYWLSATPVPFCEHLPDRPDQMPKDRPVQARSLADNSIISDISNKVRTKCAPFALSRTNDRYPFYIKLRKFLDKGIENNELEDRSNVGFL